MQQIKCGGAKRGVQPLTRPSVYSCLIDTVDAGGLPSMMLQLIFSLFMSILQMCFITACRYSCLRHLVTNYSQLFKLYTLASHKIVPFAIIAAYLGLGVAWALQRVVDRRLKARPGNYQVNLALTWSIESKCCPVLPLKRTGGAGTKCST